MNKKFYVYVHRKNTDGSVFYVGKGKDCRAWAKHGRNVYWKRIVAKHGFTVHIIVNKINEICALSIECALIKFYGRNNLCNLTDGGEGVSGLRHSEETKEKLRGPRPNFKPWLKGKHIPEYLRVKLRDAKLGKHQSPEHAKKSRKSKIGVKILDTSKFNLEKRKLIFNSMGDIFESSSDAARKMSVRLGLNVSQGNISMAARGQRKKAYGLTWSYIDKENRCKYRMTSGSTET